MRISSILQFGVGIGHLARISAIADELIKFAEVTIYCGGKPVDFVLNEAVHFVQLPPIHWKWAAKTKIMSVEPNMSASECLAEQSRILVEGYRANRPDIVITEYFPFSPGRFGSSLDELMVEVRNSTPRPLMLCSVRASPRSDHFDSQVSPEWINQCLREHYDAVFHHVDPAVFPLPSLDSYLNVALSGIPVFQTGFTRKQVSAPPTAHTKGILLTIGGGNPMGASWLKKWIAAVEYLSKDLYPVHAVCGPLMSADDRADIHRMKPDALVLHDSVANLDELMQQCRAVVCMGGYNTLIEALSLRKPVLAFASCTHHDQHFQIDRFGELGMLVKGHDHWSAVEIAGAIEALVDFSPNGCVSTDGAANTAQILKKMLGEARGRAECFQKV